MRRKSLYVTPKQLRDASIGKYGDATVYSYLGDVRSVVLKTASLKTPDKLLQSVGKETIKRIQETCKEKDIHFPSSFASIIRGYLPYDRPLPKTAQHLFDHANASPWVANRTNYIAPAVAYDLNQAYWSSILAGMPTAIDMRYLRAGETRGWDIADADIWVHVRADHGPDA